MKTKTNCRGKVRRRIPLLTAYYEGKGGENVRFFSFYGQIKSNEEM